MTDRYSQHGNSAFETWLQARTAAREARFLLPHLLPGMRVLDVGSGPGTITLGVAEAVTPGEMIGLDIQARVVDQARASATGRNIWNVRFDVGDVYRLPFDAGSFDAVPAHGLVRAERQIRSRWISYARA